MTLDYNSIKEFIHFDFYLRTILVMFYSLFLFRISNTRLFSQLAAYDLVVFILLGALLGEAIINKDSFIPCLINCLIITLFHKKMGSFSNRSFIPSKFLKGEKLVLFEDDEWNKDNLNSCCLTKEDIYQELRCSLGLDSTKNLKKIIMERNGKISFLAE
ncbi:MAG: DUF421 domain-containing protein [Tatlockia sp.]|nr:DUF421 domain-containing protein [Tatlockia sp.]